MAIEEPPAATPQEEEDSGCGESGALQASLFGSIETSIDWPGSEMMCENMLRPDKKGIRLRFAGDVGSERLAIIIAVPDLLRGAAGKELPSNVTATVEGSGRFFSTANLDSCWTDVDWKTTVESNDIFAISGTLYCVAPLGEINGDAAISIPELTFSTLVEWKQ